jgi:cytochrome P450
MIHMRQEIRGFRAVRDAARNWEDYSSDLLGDRDVRSYRQLPLEADPPRHTQFRMALSEFFSYSSIEPHTKAFEELAVKLLNSVESKKRFKVEEDLVLPYVIGCLTIIYSRPQDFDEWVSWGPDVWTAASYKRGEIDANSQAALRERDFSASTTRSGETLQAYLTRVFDEAEARVLSGEDTRDIWDFVAAMEIDGRRVDRLEMQGVANVLLAGGRDTVIKLLSGFVWHLVKNPQDVSLLQSQKDNLKSAIGEMARFISPLPRMERAPREYVSRPDSEREVDKYVLLSFVSANHDKSQWENPHVVDFSRERNPHIAFGFGAHSCLGQNITEIEGSAFLRAILPRIEHWRFAAEPAIDWARAELEDGSETIHISSFLDLEIATV